MKVICIDATTHPDSLLPVDLTEGSIYTVVDEVWFEDILWYRLQEKGYIHYSSDAFIPLSDIDERERMLQEQYSYDQR